ncbi:hypothetical protein ABT173_18565 [Streptomyces sp. NPDC001795]|uniref:hypothetical protein n=1 Tax=Streptomyces sp. NPDC001795 TaxID=3154525 RepID=UPI00331E8C1B
MAAPPPSKRPGNSPPWPQPPNRPLIGALVEIELLTAAAALAPGAGLRLTRLADGLATGRRHKRHAELSRSTSDDQR